VKTIYFKPLIFLAVWMMALVITSQARSQELVFVQVASMSGKDGADLGLGLQAGIKAYFEQVNRQGGVNGRPLKLVVVDDEYVPDKTVSLTEKAIKDHDPLALIGYRGTANTLSLMKSVVMEKDRIALAL
jgi:branched-chain amino acid transport system substrate-binding protein